MWTSDTTALSGIPIHIDTAGARRDESIPAHFLTAGAYTFDEFGGYRRFERLDGAGCKM